jgi:hypothetical protein
MLPLLRDSSSPFAQVTEIVIEELSEMVGASLILYGVLLLALRLWNRGERSQPTADCQADVVFVPDPTP